jgi:hypothetical protein
MFMRIKFTLPVIALLSLIPGTSYLAAQEATSFAQVSAPLRADLAEAKQELIESLLAMDAGRAREIRETMLVWADEHDLFVPIFDELLEENLRELTFSEYQNELIALVDFFFDPREEDYNHLMSLVLHEMSNPACSDAHRRELIGAFWSGFAQSFPETHRSEFSEAGQLIAQHIVMDARR